MDLGEILRQHQAWLDKAKAPSDQVKDTDTDLSVEAIRQRIEEAKARIADFTRQKDEAARRFDAAIAQRNEELVRLQAELSASEKLMQSVAVSGIASAATTQRPASGAAAAKRAESAKAKPSPKKK